MNPYPLDETEYITMTATTTKVVIMPSFLFWVELSLLSLVIVLGVLLCVRSRQAHPLLLSLAAMLFAIDLLSWLSTIPALASSAIVYGIVHTISSGYFWFEPLGALSLTAFGLIQLLRTPRNHVR